MANAQATGQGHLFAQDENRYCKVIESGKPYACKRLPMPQQYSLFHFLDEGVLMKIVKQTF